MGKFKGTWKKRWYILKIVHLCLASFYPDNYSYQENMLPKFHKLQGHEVEVIASLLSFDKDGKPTILKFAGTYVNEYGIKVTRLNYRRPNRIYKKMRRYIGLEKALVDASPDILFIHGCQFLDIDIVRDYRRTHPNTKTFVDNHADFSNSATNWLSKKMLHGVIWKKCAQLINPYTTKFYGVLPARVDFLVNVYSLPPEKCELLVMGADDELVKEATSTEVRKKIRKQIGISDDDFVIITGGKIDNWKKQTLNLMEAVNRIANPKVILIVFGSIVPELKDTVNQLTGKYTKYIGWLNSNDTYSYFAASDLAVFPGRHSVMWEQVVGLGKPLVCKEWEGTKHVDLGGNVRFLSSDSTEQLYEVIMDLINHKDKLYKMQKIAEENGMSYFSYDNIARRCIES